MSKKLTVFGLAIFLAITTKAENTDNLRFKKNFVFYSTNWYNSKYFAATGDYISLAYSEFFGNTGDMEAKLISNYQVTLERSILKDWARLGLSTGEATTYFSNEYFNTMQVHQVNAVYLSLQIWKYGGSLMSDILGIFDPCVNYTDGSSACFDIARSVSTKNNRYLSFSIFNPVRFGVYTTKSRFEIENIEPFYSTIKREMPKIADEYISTTSLYFRFTFVDMIWVPAKWPVGFYGSIDLANFPKIMPPELNPDYYFEEYDDSTIGFEFKFGICF